MKPIVKVSWLDAVTRAGWTDEVNAPTENITVGFQVHSCGHFMEIAATYAQDTGMWNNTISIPTENILSYEVLDECEDDDLDEEELVEIIFEAE